MNYCRYAVILAFDVKIERDAQEMADSVGVKIFQADIIYHLFDSFMKYRDELKAKKREEFKDVAVFPCKLRILPQVMLGNYSTIDMEQTFWVNLCIVTKFMLIKIDKKCPCFVGTSNLMEKFFSLL